MHMFPFQREGSEEIMWPTTVNTYWILSAIITPKIELKPGIVQIYSFQWTSKQSMKVKQSQRTWSVLIRWSISEKYCDIADLMKYIWKILWYLCIFCMGFLSSKTGPRLFYFSSKTRQVLRLSKPLQNYQGKLSIQSVICLLCLRLPHVNAHRKFEVNFSSVMEIC